MDLIQICDTFNEQADLKFTCVSVSVSDNKIGMTLKLHDTNGGNWV